MKQLRSLSLIRTIQTVASHAGVLAVEPHQHQACTQIMVTAGVVTSLKVCHHTHAKKERSGGAGPCLSSSLVQHAHLGGGKVQFPQVLTWAIGKDEVPHVQALAQVKTPGPTRVLHPAATHYPDPQLRAGQVQDALLLAWVGRQYNTSTI